MPVGKAKSTSVESVGDDFQFVVPCLSAIDETSIREHLADDHFFWWI
jgi:hypothetical protein